MGGSGSTCRLASCALVTASLAVFGAGLATPTAAQSDAVRTHVEFVADRYFDTPDGRGLLPTALAEAQIAVEYVELAQRDSTNLASMRRYATYVLHGIDPSMATSGPGFGYGVREAATAVLREMRMALAYDSLSDNIALHGRHVVEAMDRVILRADEVAVLVNQISGASNARDAARVVDRLDAATRALLRGVDGNGDGLRGWPDGDDGLEQASQHMTLMKRGEGWSTP